MLIAIILKQFIPVAFSVQSHL